MRTVFAVLSLAASAFAYSVTSPGTNQNWTTTGPNIVAWQRVNTDPQGFTLVLVNQDKTVMPSGSLILSNSVDGTTGTLTVSPPSGGLPVGDNFQVNLVTDAQAILAQSHFFSIKQGTASPSSAPGSSSRPLATTPGVTPPAQPSQSGSGSPTPTDGGDLNPTSLTNTTAVDNGAVSRGALSSGGVMVLLAVVGAFLA